MPESVTSADIDLFLPLDRTFHELAIGRAGGDEAELHCLLGRGKVLRGVHQALFVGQPLGFALHGVGTNQNLTVGMQALICRLLVALLVAVSADYVRLPVNTRQRHGLTLV